MAKAIGSASDYYRLRVMTVDTTDAVDFEWRDDILYRRPPATDIEDGEVYAVEAILLDDEEVAVTLARFADPAEAHAWLDERIEELDDMTKSEFEAGYFPPSAL